jgi:hypothetical protein
LFVFAVSPVNLRVEFAYSARRSVADAGLSRVLVQGRLIFMSQGRKVEWP